MYFFLPQVAHDFFLTEERFPPKKYDSHRMPFTQDTQTFMWIILGNGPPAELVKKKS